MDDTRIAALRKHVSKHAGANDPTAWRVLALTVLVQGAAIGLYLVGYPIPAMLLEAGLGVRMFIIYHDALHGSFFRSKRANHALASTLQAWVLTPLPYWKSNHLAHHRRFGDLGFHDRADTILFTRSELEAMPTWKRRAWRIIRTPWIFFPALPLYQWWFEYPVRRGNAVLWAGHLLHFVIAWKVSFLHLVSLYLGMLTGLVLFHLQHGINSSYREPTETWNFDRGAILGSTWVPVPWPLSWFTLGIEFHHIHHLHAGVPCYRLARCHADAEPGAWDGVTVGTWRKCLAGLRNVMWDDKQRQLATF